MAQQIINLGGIANDGTGDLLRTAFDKVNTNFTETYNNFNLVYNRIESNANIKIASNTISSTNTNGNINIVPNGTGLIVLGDSNSRTSILATNTSVSNSTGALTVAGGVGIVGNIYAGGNIYASVFHGNGAGLIGVSATSFAGGSVSGQTNFQSSAASNDTLTGAVTISGGLGIAGNLNVGGPVIKFTGATSSTSPNDGLLVVSGGVGVSGNLNIGSQTASISSTTGALKVAGGVGIVGNAYVGGNLSITGSLSAGSLDIASFFADVTGNVTSTGTSVFNNITVSNLANITSTSISNSVTTGALKVAGGTGISGNLYVGGIANIAGGLIIGTINVGSVIGNITSPGTSNFNNASLSGNLSISSGTASGSTSTGALVVSGGIGISGNLNVGANVVIGGNLTVNGTTTTINSTTLSVDDKNIILADTASPTDAAADGGGITLRGTSDKTIVWSNSTGRWSIAPGLDVPAGIQNTPIGNVTANTGAFTTLTANGATTFTAGTDSNSTTTGAVVVTGGVGVSGNVYAAKFYGDGSALTGISAGSSTTAVSVTGNAQPNITSTGTLSSLSVSGNVTAGNANITGTTTSTSTTTGALVIGGGAGIAGNLFVGGVASILRSLEKITLDSSAISSNITDSRAAGTTGHVFYYSGSLTSNWTFNMQNLGLETGQGTVITIIINQGATAYLPTQFQIDGSAQTVKWYGGSAPSGNASKVDVLNFTVVCTGVAQYLVLGQLVAFS